jgi:peptidoglycan hydrolase-like protein with peptidoglycan-binding domain
MKRLPILLATALLLAPAIAEDQFRDVQAALKRDGFYYGEVTGTESPETGAAIRRFQIRNGIPVTGKLGPETLTALGLGMSKAPAVVVKPAPAPLTPQQKQINPAPPEKAAVPPREPGSPAKQNADRPPADEAGAAVQNPSRRINANDRAVVAPPTPVPSPVSTPFATMLRDTPYATAPRAAQTDIIRRAQAAMAARRFYRGPLDGIAGPATSEAIFDFQRDADLPRTGRLDHATLAEMQLLPQPARGNPLLKPFYNPNRRRDRSVLSE